MLAGGKLGWSVGGSWRELGGVGRGRKRGSWDCNGERRGEEDWREQRRMVYGIVTAMGVRDERKTTDIQSFAHQDRYP